MTSIIDPGIQRLLGSSAPTGAPPTLEPIATRATAVLEPVPPAATGPDRAVLAQAAKVQRLLADKRAVYAIADALGTCLLPKPAGVTKAEVEAWADECGRIASALGLPDAERASDEAFTRAADAIKELAGLRSVSLEGLIAKANAFTDFQAIENNEGFAAYEQHLVLSILRDLQALAASTPATMPFSIDPDPVFTAIEAHRAAYDAWTATAADGRDLDSEGPVREAHEAALDAVAETMPRTVAGLKAWVDYICLVTEQCGCSTAEVALPRINDAIQTLVHAAPLSAVGAGHDAELLALGAELDRILALIPAAHAERFRLEAERDNTLPPVPDGLIADLDHRLGEDIEFFAAYVPGDETGRRYYTGKAIERIRTVPRFKYVSDQRVPDDELQARADAVVAAFEPWDEACRRHSAEIGYDAALAHHDDLERQARATFDRIEAITPLTLAGLAVQARTMVTYSRGNLIRHDVVERLEEFAQAMESPVLDGRNADPFPGFHLEIVALQTAISGAKADEAAAPLMDRWGEIDTLAKSTRPTTMAGAIACLDYARREHVQFNMSDGEDNEDSTANLILALLDGALGVLRREVRAGELSRVAA